MMKIKTIIASIAISMVAISCGQGGKKDSIIQNIDSIDTSIEVQDTIVESKPSVELDETYSFRIYYPNYSKIDLVCGEMPKKDNDSVILVCAAAYTVKCIDHFEHSNIIGNHVSGGNLYPGAPSDTYRGAFSYYDGTPHFSYGNWNTDLREASDKGGCLFAQDMMIHDGKIVDHWRNDNSKNLFRALCLIKGRVAIVDSKQSIPFGQFISLLTKIGVTEAIYLDMGGWKHSWYRDENGNAIDIYPNPNKYGTNWITFYK